ncbi:MAG TPA: tRNA uridine-5-carboxymethylaminomethyl(34) synthesis GTPase MnmE [Candidatus Cloacimonas acidaminovorans]|nr:tRNA uridine-5-carboxymethylaminomethyl(34) synthesis GTPase MnmE [Candidatus Cloacimonas acidaminovorans]HRS60163.1 tRNA uridine-5-carboxymethylaminomethyl(34) synthesis GTPase MnmE [Candidatus Cloacimonas sp.]HOM78731.1 tRNA uridine-5-carboxymethylaminomethyl(34) synthesis GTPase MnmE [Candidatus Cloacimonas acidaminovorans]HOS07880.1 tRNA uridine-5-carboxymethylaminomethyl(34) synthesis GTPase MnmE [Candidatus Cloacimonas acidaminovorans]HPC50338.1 tRNA uridine-5-carboxymethylaminomethyl(
MSKISEVICAPVTPLGFSAIAVIRLSGKGCIELVANHFSQSQKLLSSPSHNLIFGTFYAETGEPIDEVLISVFREPHSYTGEDVIEISCHGNPNLVNRILQTLLLSCRLAKPGEFTLRAFLNGKMDLSQAEAVNDLIQAQANQAEKAALMQLKGFLSKYLQELLARITELRIRFELAIDFADQDLPLPDSNALYQELLDIIKTAEELKSTGEQGRRLREGIKICLTGAPNVGKSSLFNALLQQNRAIVTPHPGTTRDYLEEYLSLNGFPIVIYDTAGLREFPDDIEKEGITKSYELMQESDLILYLVEATTVTNPNLQFSDLLSPSSLPPDLHSKTLVVFSKADLIQENTPQISRGIYCSVISENGLKDLTDAISKRLMLNTELPNKPIIINNRHLVALSKCLQSLHRAKQCLKENQGYEFIAFELISASNALEEILGVITTDDLLDKIFSEFCIGK